MVSGTYILTDTIKSAFSTVFTQAYKNADAVITGKSAIGKARGNPNQPPPSLHEALLTSVQGLSGVAQASGSISDSAQLVGRDGKVITRSGAPSLAFSYTPSGQRFNAFTLSSGHWPTGSNQVAIDAATASNEGFKVGHRIGVIARGPVRQFTVVGTVKFGGASLG